MRRRGRAPGGLRSLVETRTILDAGPEWLTLEQAADAIGICAQSVYDRGRLAVVTTRKQPVTIGGYGYIVQYSRLGVWHMAVEIHNAEAYQFDGSADARAAVLRMVTDWQGCETVQQLHDAAGVTPLPPVEDDHGGGRRMPTYTTCECASCGREYQLSSHSTATNPRLCAVCNRRALDQCRAWLAWRAAR